MAMRGGGLVRVRLVQLAIPVLAASACNVESRVPAFETTDSAGVVVVSNRRPAGGIDTLLQIASSPILAIGSEESGAELYRVVDTKHLTPSVFGVANQGSNQVLLFDADGSYIRAVGRDGDGPGEFRRLRRLGTSSNGASFWAFDDGLRRLSVFDLDGELLASRNIGFLEMGGRDQTFSDVRLTDDGRLVGLDWGHLSAGPTPGMSLDTAFWAVLEADGSSAVIALLPGATTVHFEFQGRGVFRTLPLTNVPSWDFAAGRLYATSGASHEVLEFSLDGRVARVIRRDLDPEPLTDGVRQDWQDVVRRAVRGSPEEGDTDAFLSVVPMADALPVHDAGLIDSEGLRWVQGARWEGALPDPPWEVFTAEGRLLGELYMPPRLRVMEIGRDYVLGVWTDGNDVEYVHRHALYRR